MLEIVRRYVECSLRKDKLECCREFVSEKAPGRQVQLIVSSYLPTENRHHHCNDDSSECCLKPFFATEKEHASSDAKAVQGVF